MPDEVRRYQVVIQPPVEEEIDAIVEFHSKTSSGENARRFMIGMLDAIASLEEMPKRYPVIPETVMLDCELRHLRYAGYRVIYWIDGALVRIVHIRHGSRRALRRGDIDWDV